MPPETEKVPEAEKLTESDPSVSAEDTGPVFQRKPASKKKLLVWAGVVVLLVVIAIAVGVGVGVTRHRHSSDDVPATAENTDWRLDTATEYHISPKWNSSEPPTTRVYNFTVSEILGAPDGFERTLTVVNGKFPGPLVECNEGDRLVINVLNNGTNATSIHFHGQYQNGTAYMDGTSSISQCPIPAGHSFTYNFTVADQWGTYWWHSHFGPQYQDGVFGPVVVHSPTEDALLRDQYDEEYIVLLGDWYHSLADAYMEKYLSSGNENTEPVPDNGLINGAAFFNCSDVDETCYQDQAARTVFNFVHGKTYRLRLINVAAFAEIDFSIDDHELVIVEADGTNVEPLTVHKMRTAVGQRYSVLVTANQTATDTFWMRGQLNTYCFAENNDLLDPNTLAVVHYVADPANATNITTTLDASTSAWGNTKNNVLCKDLNTTDLVPSISEVAPDADIFFRLDTSFQIKAYAIDLAYINGTTWVPMSGSSTLYSAFNQLSTQSGNYTELNATGVVPSKYYENDKHQYMISIQNRSVVDILINNLDDGAHPFHLHGYKFWVLSFGQGTFHHSKYDKLDKKNPMKRDTLQIPGYGWALIRFVADNPGIWPLHCHITWHMEAGLLMQFQVQPDKIAQMNPPDEWAELCEL
ncbi:multicopper oxidase [Dipodascopsis tothii]|uniref:multicopper oxidase n=1 Tax=Dipodascopsis tothii TaxID=44089 RepID=UPI0034CEC980